MVRKVAIALILAMVAAGLCVGREGGSGRKASPEVYARPNLVVLYTSSARGQIRSCNCTKFRFGGYGRQLTLLKSIRRSSRDTILIEGGDITGGSGFQAKLKTDVIVQALSILGYQAMVPGEEELGLHGEQNVKPFEKQPAPLVCANLYDKGASQPKYKPSVILTTSGGLKVGIIGVIDKSLGGEFLEKTFGQSISDPVQAVQSRLGAVRRKCDLVIVVVPRAGGVSEKAGDQRRGPRDMHPSRHQGQPVPGKGSERRGCAGR